MYKVQSVETNANRYLINKRFLYIIIIIRGDCTKENSETENRLREDSAVGVSTREKLTLTKLRFELSQQNVYTNY